MLSLRRLNTGEWNKPPVLTLATAIIMRRLAELYGKKKIQDIAIIYNGQGLKEADRDQSGSYQVFAAGGQVGNHNECLTIDFFNSMNCGNIGMIQSCGGLSFNFKALSFFLSWSNMVRKEFYGDFSIQLCVQCFVDDAHATFADLFEDFVV